MSNQLFKVSHDLATQYHSKNVSPNKKTFRYELTHRGQLSVGDTFDTPVGKHCEYLSVLTARELGVRSWWGEGLDWVRLSWS